MRYNEGMKIASAVLFFDYCMDNESLKRVHSFEDLRINKLTFEKHIENVKSSQIGLLDFK